MAKTSAGQEVSQDGSLREGWEAAQKAREAFLLKWKRQCPGVATSLEEAGEELLTFYQFPESQWAHCARLTRSSGCN